MSELFDIRVKTPNPIENVNTRLALSGQISGVTLLATLEIPLHLFILFC